ncbi:MAG TPA: hypothetical protein VMT58_03180 [Candidatus Binataceae bacterium]|nr:hypothetical protein [Candidatus Binataceae bacterium]
MKTWISTAAIFAATMLPRLAWAAEEGGQEHGSWLVLSFFAINFALFAFALVYFAVPLARKFFADRAVTIRTGLSRAETAFTEAQDLANRAAGKIAALEQEIETLAAELDEETAFQVRRISDAAKTASDRVRRDAELGAAATADAATRRVRLRLADAAADIATGLISSQFRSDDQARLIDRFMDRIDTEGRQ